MKYKDYETYVIGIDHGYNNMKLAIFVFQQKLNREKHYQIY